MTWNVRSHKKTTIRQVVAPPGGWEKGRNFVNFLLLLFPSIPKVILNHCNHFRDEKKMERFKIFFVSKRVSDISEHFWFRVCRSVCPQILVTAFSPTVFIRFWWNFVGSSGLGPRGSPRNLGAPGPSVRQAHAQMWNSCAFNISGSTRPILMKFCGKFRLGSQTIP